MVYQFKIKSLISVRIYYVLIIFISLLVASADNGLNGIYQASEMFGGLWIILAFVILGFAESAIKLAGHRLEIRDGLFIFKTLFQNNWSIPIASIQRIDAKPNYVKRKGNYFTFATDNKEYECDFELKNYSQLLSDLVIINPNIQVKNRDAASAMLGVPGNVPLNNFFESKLKTDSWYKKVLVKISSLNFITVFFIFFILAILLIFGVIALENFKNAV